MHIKRHLEEMTENCKMCDWPSRKIWYKKDFLKQASVMFVTNSSLNDEFKEGTA